MSYSKEELSHMSPEERRQVYRDCQQQLLVFMAENKIDPASEQGQHCQLDLKFAVNEYNQVFIEHGLNPQLSVNCKRI